MAELLTYRGAVYVSECDHIGHMNITWYTHKFDQANWNMFAEIGVTPSYLRSGAFGVAGVQQNINYRKEVFAGDVVEIRTRILEIREKAVRFEHTMRNAETEEIAAICEITAVHLDRRTHKASPFPADVIERAQKQIE